MSFRYWIYYIPLALLINVLALYGMEYAGFLSSESQKQKELELSVRLWAQAPAWLPAAPHVPKNKKAPPLVQYPLTRSDALQKIQSRKKKKPKVLTLPLRLEEANPLREQKSASSQKKSPGRKPGKDSSNVKHDKIEYLRQTAPEYPRRAWELGQEGTVILRVLVGRDGSVDKLKVYRSSKFKLLDQAAIAAVKEWEFKTEKQGLYRLAAWIKVPVRFVLEEQN